MTADEARKMTEDIRPEVMELIKRTLEEHADVWQALADMDGGREAEAVASETVAKR